GLLPELLSQKRNPLQGLFQTGFVAGHSAFFPKELPQLPMEGSDAAVASDREQSFGHALDLLFRLFELGMIRGHSLLFGEGKIVSQRVRQNKIAIRQPLHERASAKSIRSMIGEVRFT